MFLCGNSQYLENLYQLGMCSWRTIVDQMTDVLHINMVQDYKILLKYLIDLISVNPGISINLNIDVENHFLCLFVEFLIALYVGTLTLPILIADYLSIRHRFLMMWFLIFEPRLHTVKPSNCVLLFCPWKK